MPAVLSQYNVAHSQPNTDLDLQNNRNNISSINMLNQDHEYPYWVLLEFEIGAVSFWRKIISCGCCPLAFSSSLILQYANASLALSQTLYIGIRVYFDFPFTDYVKY